jgi:hypothetical protein
MVRISCGYGVATAGAWTVLLREIYELHGLGTLAKPCAKCQTEQGHHDGPSLTSTSGYQPRIPASGFAREAGLAQPYLSAIRVKEEEEDCESSPPPEQRARVATRGVTPQRASPGGGRFAWLPDAEAQGPRRRTISPPCSGGKFIEPSIRLGPVYCHAAE